MGELDRQLLAERAMAVERQLAGVAARLPAEAADLQPASDAADAVILHLWQAVQLVIDLAVAAFLRFALSAPQGYADAFRRLHGAGVLESDLADRLVRAAGFRNVVAHAYDTLDMARVHQAARVGPADLRAFLAALERHLPPG